MGQGGTLTAQAILDAKQALGDVEWEELSKSVLVVPLWLVRKMGFTAAELERMKTEPVPIPEEYRGVTGVYRLMRLQGDLPSD